MNGMRLLADICDPYTHPLACFSNHRFCAWKCPAVEREDIEIGHDIGIRRCTPWIHEPFIKKDRVVTIDFGFRLFRMNDKKSHGSQSQLKSIAPIKKALTKKAIMIFLSFIDVLRNPDAVCAGVSRQRLVLARHAQSSIPSNFQCIPDAQ